MDEAVASGLNFQGAYNRDMQRWLRILVLVLTVMPLGLSVAQLLPPARCVAQMAVDHVCCPQHAQISAPSCCNAKVDTLLTEAGATADEALTGVTFQAVSPMLPQTHEEVGFSSDSRPAYISILVPALILRT